MKSKLIYSLIAGSMMLTGFISCNNDEFLDVTRYDVGDVGSQFENAQAARVSLNGIYAYNNVSREDNSWGYKPNLFTGSHPTMDTQCTGWDVKFLNQTWDENVGELEGSRSDGDLSNGHRSCRTAAVLQCHFEPSVRIHDCGREQSSDFPRNLRVGNGHAEEKQKKRETKRGNRPLLRVAKWVRTGGKAGCGPSFFLAKSAFLYYHRIRETMLCKVEV